VTARDLFSPDLLAGLDGIESGLRRRRSLGRIGTFGLVALFALQLSLVILSAARHVSWQSIVKEWYIAVPSIFLAVTLVLFVAARYWLRESRTPFRYTCRIVEFGAVPPTPDKALPWLRYDLMELLNDRIRRLSFRDTEPQEPEEQEAHLHIAGEYLVREDDERPRTLEVTPRVRVGGEHAAQSLAHAVRYALPTAVLSKKNRSAADTFSLKPDDYDKVLERVYFSVASHLYKQIRDDVERKIDLLPTRYLRATAYLYEAEDYAQSNTLDAYDDAQTLFENARRLYTPSAIRNIVLHLVGRHAKRQAMLARTELGLANTLVSRRALARLSGRRANQIFEAREIAECARDRLERLANKRKRRGADDALFDARVTLALTLHYLGSDDKADDELKIARASLPGRAEESPHYLFAAALLEPRTTSALSLLRRAVELRPRFEVAQFERARRTEALWQFRPELEKTVADTVKAQYMEVVRINPGNIRAWSSLGHTFWLLAANDEELKEAQRYFVRGLEYKEIKRETFTAGLEYSLARLSAELGEFTDAYRHYVASTTASVGEGIAHGTWAEQHNSVVRNDAMLRRFERYRDKVACRAEEQAADEIEPRIVSSVMAFVENDYGEASLNFYERTGKEKLLDQARDQYNQARKTNKTYVVPMFNLCLLSRTYGQLTDAQRHIEAVRRREPKWPEAQLEEMLVEAWSTRDPADDWAKREAEIKKERKVLEGLKKEEEELQQRETAGDGADVDQAGPQIAARASGLGADAREIVAPGADLDHLRAQIEAHTKNLEAKRRECEKLKKTLEDSANRARETVHELVPHEWLWQVPSKKDSDFRWNMLHQRSKLGRRAYDPRWARHFGDLHVRALETWAITRAFGRVDEAERGKLRRIAERGGIGHGHPTRDLLDLLETKFWPDRQEILVARLRLQLTGERPTDRLGSLAARTLAFDPANFHLLTLADETLSESDEAQGKRKRDAFIEALGQRDVAPPVLAWLGKRLETMEECESALRAFDRALEGVHDADGGQPVDIDETTVLVGKARAEWGLRRHADAVATLARVPSGNDGDGWRTEFVRVIAERDQVESPKPPANSDGDLTQNGRGRRRFELSAFRKSGAEQAPEPGSASEDDAPDAPADEEQGYRTLASWLRREHAAGISDMDTARAFDAGRALLRLAAARYVELAPNRTRRLPTESAAIGDVDSSTVPLVQRLALEFRWSAIEGSNEFWTFVGEKSPDICERLHEDTGVPVPLPRIRINDSSPNDVSFRVLVNELPVGEVAIVDGDYDNVARVMQENVHRHLKKIIGVDDIVVELQELLKEDAQTRDAVLGSDEAKMLMVQIVRRLLEIDARVDLAEVAREVRHSDTHDVETHVKAIQARRPSETSKAGPAQRRNGLPRGPSWVVSR
jgi:hypothetical protein